MKFEDLARLWFLKQLNISVDDVDLDKMGMVDFDVSAYNEGYGCDTCDYGANINIEYNISAHVVYKNRKREYKSVYGFNSMNQILKSVLEFEQGL